MTTLEFDNISIAQQLFGFHNTHLNKIAKRFGVTIHSRGGTVTISGPDLQVQRVCSLLDQLYPLFKKKILLEPGDLDAAIALIKKDPDAPAGNAVHAHGVHHRQKQTGPAQKPEPGQICPGH